MKRQVKLVSASSYHDHGMPWELESVNGEGRREGQGKRTVSPACQRRVVRVNEI